jgi:hypothetical protein
MSPLLIFVDVCEGKLDVYEEIPLTAKGLRYLQGLLATGDDRHAVDSSAKTEWSECLRDSTKRHLVPLLHLLHPPRLTPAFPRSAAPTRRPGGLTGLQSAMYDTGYFQPFGGEGIDGPDNTGLTASS